MIHVEIEPTRAIATVRTSDTCAAKTVRAPRCHFAQVWQQALAGGTPSDYVVRIGWTGDATWFFDAKPDGSGGVMSLPDRCP